MKNYLIHNIVKFLFLFFISFSILAGGNESDSLLIESLDEVLIEEYKPCSDQSDNNSFEVSTISSLMIISDGSFFNEGEVITSSSGAKAIVNYYDVETQKLSYYQDASTGFKTFLLNETIEGSYSGIGIVKEFIFDLTIPCTELIVSIEEEPQQMIFTPKKSAEEAKLAAELAATEMMAEIEEELARQASLEAFQKKLAEEKAAAAASTAAYQSKLEYDAMVAEQMEALERQKEIDAFEAQLEAELASAEIMDAILAQEAAERAAAEMMAEMLADEERAKRLAEFLAKVEAEKAAAARSTEIYQARQQQEQMIKDRQAQLALEREIAEFEAKLEKELAFQEWYANFLENKAAEEALEKELAAFEAQLEAELAAQEMMAEMIAEEERAKRLAEFQAKLEEERAAAAASTAAYQSKLTYDAMVEELMEALAIEQEIAAFEAELAADLASDALDRELAEFEAQLEEELANQAALEEFLAKLANERAAAAASTAAYQAKVAYDARVAKIKEDLVEQLEEVIEPDNFKSHLVEELIAKASAKLEEEKFIGAISGEIVTVAIHEFCEDKLNLSDSNIALFKKALAGGYLGNVGPKVEHGTEFTANRWDKYVTCVSSLGN